MHIQKLQIHLFLLFSFLLFSFSYTEQLVPTFSNINRDRIHVGFDFTVATDDNGNLWAWGFNGEDGRLGIGDAPPIMRSSPTQVSITGNFSRVTGGKEYSFALEEDGTDWWAWGRNHRGQLGIGSQITQTTPVKIPDSHKFKIIKGGFFHSIAIDNDGHLWSWGHEGNGKLGRRVTQENPANKPGRVDTSLKFETVECGNMHSVAVDVDGNIWTWGENVDGQLGNGNFQFSDKLLDITESLGGKVKQAVTGRAFSMALNEHGQLWAWGKNEDGQLGLNHTDPDSYNTPQLVTEIPTTGYTIEASSAISFVWNEAGQLWTWGSNSRGALGHESQEDYVSIPTLAKLDRVRFPVAGLDFMHAIRNGVLWSWGSNNAGQLGLGIPDILRLEPTPMEPQILVRVENLKDDLLEPGIDALFNVAALRFQDNSIDIHYELLRKEVDVYEREASLHLSPEKTFFNVSLPSNISLHTRFKLTASHNEQVYGESEEFLIGMVKNVSLIGLHDGQWINTNETLSLSFETNMMNLEIDISLVDIESTQRIEIDSFTPTASFSQILLVIDRTMVDPLNLNYFVELKPKMFESYSASSPVFEVDDKEIVDMSLDVDVDENILSVLYETRGNINIVDLEVVHVRVGEQLLERREIENTGQFDIDITPFIADVEPDDHYRVILSASQYPSVQQFEDIVIKDGEMVMSGAEKCGLRLVLITVLAVFLLRNAALLIDQ